MNNSYFIDRDNIKHYLLEAIRKKGITENKTKYYLIDKNTKEYISSIYDRGYKRIFEYKKIWYELGSVLGSECKKISA